jgi:glucose uptake protein GlcU
VLLVACALTCLARGVASTHNNMLYCIILLFYDIAYCIVLYCIVLYCILLYTSSMLFPSSFGILLAAGWMSDRFHNNNERATAWLSHVPA